MNKNDKVYVAGHRGLIGSAIVRRLIKEGYTRILVKERDELDLTDQVQVKSFFEQERPTFVFFAAAKVGGVWANNAYRADFLHENLVMQTNVIHSAFAYEVNKLVFFGCSDVYPKEALRLAREDDLLTGPLEPTCEPFALAKIAGIKACESYNRQYGTSFIAVIPTNVYGPNQHYDVMNSQVVPSLVKRFHEAKVAGADELRIWGTGLPIRDFVFVDDVVDACFILVNADTEEYLFNVGAGNGTSINDLANVVAEAVGFGGKITLDTTKPDGADVKLLDISRMKAMGWAASTPLLEGIQQTYWAFMGEMENGRVRASRIRHIQVCQKDLGTLAKLTCGKQVTQYPQPQSYANTVVVKPWGHEFLVFQNSCVAIWMLHIRKGYSTSMHVHCHKKTSLVMLSGVSMSNTFFSRHYLLGGDAVVYDAGVFHSTKCVSDNGAFLLEIETPPDKTDLVRLKDRHGRELTGYESISEMRTSNLNAYEYFYCSETDEGQIPGYDHARFRISFESYSGNDEFQKRFRLRPGQLCIVCRGALKDDANDTILNVGETQTADSLNTMPRLTISGPLVVMKTESKDK